MKGHNPTPRIAAREIVVNGAHGQLFLGDCRILLEAAPPSGVDLVYIDPPYLSKRQFRSRGKPGPGTVGPLNLAFDDRWKGGQQEYLAFLEGPLRQIHRVLKPQGVLLVHLDWHMVHYVKVMLDQIFGDDSLINELIWYYQTGGASRRRFSRKHDTILVYGRSEEHYFDAAAVAVPRSPKALHRARWSKGARISADNTHKIPDDVLLIPALNPMARERNGYPTQKPLALLEVLIQALCPPGGMVADYFCGSGTTLVAAQRLGRHFIGCDISSAAVHLAKARLLMYRQTATNQ